MLQARTSQSRSLSARVRRSLVAAVSLFVVVAGVAYVFAPSDPTLEFGVAEITGAAPAYDVDLIPEYSLAAANLAERKRWREVIYGTVESRGVPVRDVRVTFQGVGGKKMRKQKATIRPKGTGTYRSVLRLKPGKYKVTVTLKAGGKNRMSRTTRRIKNNRAYDVSVRVRESGVITMLPISSY
jgi:hypothetical protein